MFGWIGEKIAEWLEEREYEREANARDEASERLYRENRGLGEDDDL